MVQGPGPYQSDSWSGWTAAYLDGLHVEDATDGLSVGVAPEAVQQLDALLHRADRLERPVDDVGQHQLHVLDPHPEPAAAGGG